MNVLNNRNITTIELPIWIRWVVFNIYHMELSLSRMFRDRDRLIGEIVDQVWELFVELRPTIETINAAVGHPSDFIKS